MMTVQIDGVTYRAETAVGLIDQIKGMHWGAGENATAERYLAVQKKAYKARTGKPLRLPWGDTEKKALAMFKAIDAAGGWIFKENE